MSLRKNPDKDTESNSMNCELKQAEVSGDSENISIVEIERIDHVIIIRLESLQLQVRGHETFIQLNLIKPDMGNDRGVSLLPETSRKRSSYEENNYSGKKVKSTVLTQVESPTEDTFEALVQKAAIIKDDKKLTEDENKVELRPNTPDEEEESRDPKAFEQLDDDIQQINIFEASVKGFKEDKEGVSEESNSGTPKDKAWNDKSRYEDGGENCDPTSVRRYEEAYARVKDFYKEQHAKQTVAYNIQARVNFMTKHRAKMTIWEALEKLNTLIDESDPDTELSQIQHALQTAEAIRQDGKPRWMQLTGLIHDLGKLLYFYDSKGQWDVVGDTFPVGCAFDNRIIFPEEFKENPDFQHPVYSTEFGIYSEACGLDKIMLSWGHDEYMYHVAKQQSTLPPEALAMIRYHSFYSWHREGAYTKLMNEQDHKMLEAVKAFNPYDLYSKKDGTEPTEKLKPYYLELIDEYFPTKTINF